MDGSERDGRSPDYLFARAALLTYTVLSRALGHFAPTYLSDSAVLYMVCIITCLNNNSDTENPFYTAGAASEFTKDHGIKHLRH